MTLEHGNVNQDSYFTKLPIADIRCDYDFNCRNSFTLESVKSLAESIREKGLDVPVSVRPYEPVAPWQLVAGFRRFTACVQILGWTEIPAKVYPHMTDEEAFALNYRENLERKDLNPVEEAQGIANMYDLWDQVNRLKLCEPDPTPIQWDVPLRTIQAAINKSYRWIQMRLRLLTLPDEIQNFVALGYLSVDTVESLYALPTRKEQLAAAQDIVTARSKSRKYRRHMKNPDNRKIFKRPQSKAALRKMIGYLLNKGIDGLAPRALAWAAGSITDKEFRDEVREYCKQCPPSKSKSSKRGQSSSSNQ